MPFLNSNQQMKKDDSFYDTKNALSFQHKLSSLQIYVNKLSRHFLVISFLLPSHFSWREMSKVC